MQGLESEVPSKLISDSVFWEPTAVACSDSTSVMSDLTRNSSVDSLFDVYDGGSETETGKGSEIDPLSSEKAHELEVVMDLHSSSVGVTDIDVVDDSLLFCEPIQIFCRYSQSCIVLNVFATTRVKTVKQMICIKMGIRDYEQCSLSYRGRILDEEYNLKGVQIVSGANLDFNVKMRGGMLHNQSRDSSPPTSRENIQVVEIEFGSGNRKRRAAAACSSVYQQLIPRSRQKKPSTASTQEAMHVEEDEYDGGAEFENSMELCTFFTIITNK